MGAVPKQGFGELQQVLAGCLAADSPFSDASGQLEKHVLLSVHRIGQGIVNKAAQRIIFIWEGPGIQNRLLAISTQRTGCADSGPIAYSRPLLYLQGSCYTLG